MKIYVPFEILDLTQDHETTVTIWEQKVIDKL